jgi:hypothetical protein
MKIFRAFGIVLLGTLALVFTLVFLILARPKVVLNKSTLLFAASMLSKSGTAITWANVEVQAESAGLLKKKLTLDFTGLCIRERTMSAYNGCFDRARLSVVGGLVRFIPKVTEAGPIEIDNGKVLVDMDRLEQVNRAKPKEKERKKKAKPFRVENLAPSFLKGAQIHPVRLDVSRFEIRQNKKRIVGELHLSEKDNRIELAGNALSGKENYGLSVRLVNDKDFWAWNHWNVQGDANALLADRRKVGLTLNVSPHFISVEKPAQGKWKLKRSSKEEAVALDFSIQGRTQKAAQSILADVSGSYVPSKLDAKISATARHLSPGLAKLTLSSCGLTVERQNPSQSDSRYQMDCRIDGTVPVPPKHLRFFEIPTEAGLRVQADLMSSDFIPSDTTQLQGKVDAVLNPILTPIFEGRAELHSRLDGVAGEFPRSGQIDSQVAVEMRIPDFQKLNQRLNKTAWGIPAPFQALEGDVTFRSTGSANLEQGSLPIKLQTRLKSNSQSVNLDAGGTVEVTDIRTDPWTQANFVLTLTDLKLLLPRLKLEKPPRLFPESRIHTLEPIEKAQGKVSADGEIKKAEEKESSFGYRAVIRTPPGSPVQIITNLAKGPIPVNLDINLSSESPPTGQVRVGVFPVEAFRRKATVQHFDIDLVAKAGDSAIDGRVDVPLGDYQAHIDVVGSIDKPQVRVTSDPPVGEDQLLAALLFNRTPEELDPSESATVGSTRATVSQGALSLASLFLLASTPVEGLSYNPDTGQVTAQVRISEGLSLNVGSGENQAGAVGVRKRIGSNFFVTTNVNNIIQNSSTVSAYVEWRKRY